MRRRDADSYSPTHTRLFSRQGLFCTGASLAVHAGLLLTLATVPVSSPQPVKLLFVTLRPGGGHGEVPAASPNTPAVAAAPEAVVAPPRPKPPRKKIARVRRARKPPKRAPVEVATTRTAARSAATTAEGTGASASGAGTGAGSGRGSGRGNGTGTGLGGDTRAYCEYCPEPTYPLLARRRGWKGTVDVGLILLADGRVDRATLRRSSGHDMLDREAIEVARRSRFHLPGPTTAPLHGRIEYRFELVPPR